MKELFTDSVEVPQINEKARDLNWLQKSIIVEWKYMSETQIIVYNHKHQLIIYKVENCV